MRDISSLTAALAAFVITFIFGFVFVPYLKKLHFGQSIRDEGPKWHKGKQGTPTMGGVMMIIGFFASLALTVAIAAMGSGSLNEALGNPYKLTLFLSGAVLSLGMGAIGFVDDYIKVVKKRNLGLTAMQKTILQMMVSAAFLASIALCGVDSTYIPFVGYIDIMHGAGLIFWPIALFFVYGFTNAVNLTDGIDGLASSVTLVVACAFIVYSALTSGNALNGVSACALAGACLGFFLWNANPAKVFMGDTGSLFLGGAVVALAFGTGCPILLLLFGFVYLCEAMSVVIQVLCYKIFKKRIFKMSPIHHHFEMCGWSENKIVTVFSIVTAVTSAAAIYIGVNY